MGLDTGRRLTDHFEDFLARCQGFSKRDRKIDQITPYPLWVGHAGDGSDFRRLAELGIVAVVQVALEEPPLMPPRGMMYHRFPLLDGPGNPPEVLRFAVETVASLVRLRVPTLVCCGMGLSRSPAITASALSLVLDEPADEVLRCVAGLHRVDISPGLWGEVRLVGGFSTNEVPR
jgi:hypothetical protein